MSTYAVSSRLLIAGFVAGLACGPAFGADSPDSSAKSAQPTVVFVCKYGSVKSLVAAERFNRLAEQRGLAVRAIGRAANPGTLHTEVPELVIRELALEGIHVADYKPQVLTPQEASAAVRVVHISLQGEPDPDSSVVAAFSRVRAERWNDVPTMLYANGAIDLSGGQYNRARTPLVTHVDALFDDIAKKQGSVAAK